MQTQAPHWESQLLQQSDKIQILLRKNEEIGALLEKKEKERELLFVECERLLRERQDILQWKRLGEKRLGPNVIVAGQQLDILWDHTQRMGSFGHRLVSFWERTWLGRAVRRVASIFLAIIKA